MYFSEKSGLATKLIDSNFLLSKKLLNKEGLLHSRLKLCKKE
jgi:hypothetical protein